MTQKFNLILLSCLFAAVKFGRMSKKQREKVEGEANLIKQGISPGVNGYGPDPDLAAATSPNNNSYSFT